MECIHEKSVFADTRETYFEAWKRSQIGCSALLCGRFAESQESRFQAMKCSNMGSPVLEGVCSANIHEFCFQAAKGSDMDCIELQGGLIPDCKERFFKFRNVQIIAGPFCKTVDLLIFTKTGFRVRNVEICAVWSSNEVDMLMLRNRVLGPRSD